MPSSGELFQPPLRLKDIHKKRGDCPMKKCALLSSLAAVLPLLAALLLLLPSPSERALTQLEENCDVPFLLTTPAGELPDLPNALRTEGFGCYGLENEDLSLTLGGYPDVQDPYCLTRFTLRSPRYHLFGLRVGDTLAAAEQALAQQGYHPLQEDTGPERIRPLAYAKGPLSVSLGLSGDPERLSSLTVSIAVTNRENVVF